MSNIGKKAERELYDIIRGFNLIPTMKNKLNGQLEDEYGISKEVIDNMYDDRFFEINEDDKEKIMYALYKITKRESINPEKTLKSNTISMEDTSEYYNYETKYKFADSHYSRNTKEVMMNYFRKSCDLEKKYAKDVYDFNKPEVEVLLTLFKAKTVRSLQNIISSFSKYVEYALEENLTDNTNHFKEYSTANDIKHMLNTDKQSVFNRKEILSIMHSLDNVQDAVTVGLIYEGVSIKKRGEQPFAELVNIKERDIDFKNCEIFLSNADNNEFSRTIKISQELMDLIDVSLKQTEYYISSAISSEGLDGMRAVPLKKTDYLLKGLVGSGLEKDEGYKSSRMNSKNINQRMLKIVNKYLDKDSYNFTARTISYSGQIEMYKELTSDLKEGQKDSKRHSDAVLKVFKKFGIKPSKSSIFYFEKRIPKEFSKKESFN